MMESQSKHKEEGDNIKKVKNPQPPIRLIIADDHILVLEGLTAVLEVEPGFEIVGLAGDGQQAIDLIEKVMPDVALLDITMPIITGLELTRKISDEYPKVKVLILTMHEEEAFFFEALRAGAAGYVLKGARSDELIGAIRAVYERGVYLSPKLAGAMVKEFLKVPTTEPLDTSLTSRQQEILRLIAQGLTNNMIARELDLSLNTVKSHRMQLYKKLNLDDRSGLVAYAIRHGLIRG